MLLYIFSTTTTMIVLFNISIPSSLKRVLRDWFRSPILCISLSERTVPILSYVFFFVLPNCAMFPKMRSRLNLSPSLSFYERVCRLNQSTEWHFAITHFILLCPPKSHWHTQIMSSSDDVLLILSRLQELQFVCVTSNCEGRTSLTTTCDRN